MTTLAQPKDSLEVCYSNILVVSRTLGMLVIIEEDQLCCSNLSREESSVLLYCDTFFATYIWNISASYPALTRDHLSAKQC